MTRAPASCAAATRLGQDVDGPQRRQVAGLPVDPVGDELDPPVAPRRLAADLLDQAVGLDLRGVAPLVAAGPGDVPARPDQPRQVVAVVDPAGVGGAAGVAQQQRAGVAVGQRLLLRRLPVGRPRRDQTDVAVGVDEPGEGPALERRVDGSRRAVVGDPAVEDPRLVADLLGSDEHRAAQVEDGQVT